MATFPRLKTAAVAQYPANRIILFQNRVLRFLDGKEQRYRERGNPLHRWEIRLNELDEGEIAAIDGFFWSNQGRLGSFAFTDPWDGTTYPDCSLASDDLELLSLGEMRGKTELIVAENRS